MIHDAVKTFIINEDVILSGKFDVALLEKSKYKAQIQDIISLSIKNIYQSKEVIQKEVVGHRAISTLLNHYTHAAVRLFKGEPNSHDKLILSLVNEGMPIVGKSHYETLLNATCFVASLSDGKALRMAQDIGG